MAETGRSAEQLLREAADLRLISVLLSQPDAGWRQELELAQAETSDPLLQEASSAALVEAEEGVYHSIFGPGGPAPPREASYRTTLQLGYLLAELEAYYRSFGYSASGRDVLDHVSVEADFAAYLLMKQAVALSAGSSGQAQVAESAWREFLTSHLSVVALPLSQSLAQSGVRYLAMAAQALFERVGPPRSRLDGALAAANELVEFGDEPFSCVPNS